MWGELQDVGYEVSDTSVLWTINLSLLSSNSYRKMHGIHLSDLLKGNKYDYQKYGTLWFSVSSEDTGKKLTLFSLMQDNVYKQFRLFLPIEFCHRLVHYW